MNQRGRPLVPKAAKDAWARERRAVNIQALARNLGISQPAVAKWPHVPADRLEAVVRLTGIPHERLRPDLFPDLFPDPWSGLLTPGKDPT